MKFHPLTVVLVLLAPVVLLSSAAAQRYDPPRANGRYDGYGAYGPYGYYNSPATPAGSYYRGMSDLIRSQGEKNLYDANAAEKVEDARKKYLENRLRATETYFRMKEINQAYRDEQRGPRPTQEELFRLARMKAPDRLSPSELDPISGEIGWPILLLDESFTPIRTRVDEMLEYWAEHSNRLSIAQYTTLQKTLDDFESGLVAAVDATPPKPYAEARTFLESLRYELQLAQGY